MNEKTWSSDTGFEIQALVVWDQARYVSVTDAPHSISESERRRNILFLWNLNAKVRFEPAISDFPRQTPRIHPIMVQCLISVADGGPALGNVPGLVGAHLRPCDRGLADQCSNPCLFQPFISLFRLAVGVILSNVVAAFVTCRANNLSRTHALVSDSVVFQESLCSTSLLLTKSPSRHKKLNQWSRQ